MQAGYNQWRVDQFRAGLKTSTGGMAGMELETLVQATAAEPAGYQVRMNGLYSGLLI